MMAAATDAFARARRCQQAGDLRQAEQLYQQVVQAEAGNATAWCLLGTVTLGLGKAVEATTSLQQAVRLDPDLAEAHARLGVALAERGKSDEAVASYQRALQLRPEDADTHFNLSHALAAMGRLEQSVQSLQQVLRYKPDHVDAHTNLGITLARQRKLHDAVACLRHVLRLKPDHAKALNNLGVALCELGQTDEAVDCYRRALQAKPDYAEAHFNLGVALYAQKMLAEAADAYRHALKHKPDMAGAQNNLGLALVELGRGAEAAVYLQQALRLQPDFADAHNNLGLALADQGRFAEALPCYDQALRLKPNYLEAFNNMGAALAALDRHDEALACYQQALWLKPDYPEVHWHRALTWLQMGNYEQGWPEYEWRWKRRRAVPRNLPKPQWDGSSLEGKTILLYAEQGLGDTIQFIRYAPLVKARGGTVVVECPGELIGLLSTCTGIDRLVARGSPLPAYDVQAALLSLPALFQTTVATIPASVPYLAADPERIRFWTEELRGVEGLKVGIAWQGNPQHQWDRHRSFALGLFEPLARLDGVRLFSLQKGPGMDQLGEVAEHLRVTDLGRRFADTAGAFTDAAAAMKELDLVIICDSALAHLAGALGGRAWVVLSALTDWRWLRKRIDSPWYPTLRLFRQRTLGNWEEVFERITGAVQQLQLARQP